MCVLLVVNLIDIDLLKSMTQKRIHEMTATEFKRYERRADDLEAKRAESTARRSTTVMMYTTVSVNRDRVHQTIIASVHLPSFYSRFDSSFFHRVCVWYHSNTLLVLCRHPMHLRVMWR
jgi:hypothetical protein